MRIGVWFYGLATVVTGILDIVWGAFEGSHQPIKAFGQHIPGQQVLAYIAGVWLVAAGVAILWRRTARIGAAGSAAIYLIFALFWLPRFYVVPHTLGFHIGILIFIVFGLAQQLLLAAPGVMVYAETASDPVWRERQVIAARWMLGLSPIVFGLGHLINVHGDRTLRPALGSVWKFLDSAHGHRFRACRQCYCLGNSRPSGREASYADAVPV